MSTIPQRACGGSLVQLSTATNHNILWAQFLIDEVFRSSVDDVEPRGRGFMPDLETTRFPLSVVAAQELVAAVSEKGDMAERHYLELKSSLDLSTKKDKEKIAKFILGAANRMPDVAAAAFEGYGVMIIGVSEGEITGIPPVEMMEISKVVQQYVGAGGPRWDVVWVPIEGSTNQVLLIVVDPPKLGQAAFVCRATGETLTSGRSYIRAEGETREANADEVDLLLKRGSTLPKAVVNLRVELIGDISAVTMNDDLTIEQYLGLKRRQLLGALPSKEPVPPTGSKKPLSVEEKMAAAIAPAVKKFSAMIDAMSAPEDRTEEQYREEIGRWETNFRNAWGIAKAQIVLSQLTPIIVKVTNLSTTFFQGVEVKLHLDGQISAYDYVNPALISDLTDLELPRPPRLWGPRPPTWISPQLTGLVDMSYMTRKNLLPPSVSFRNGGSVDIELEVGELRPLGSYESEDEQFVLLVGDKTLTSIHGTWQFTARDHNEVYSGVIDVPVGKPKDPTNYARRVLELDAENVEQ